MRDETIWDVLNRDLFFVKDAVKRSEAKFSDKLDVYDPAQRVVTMEVREPEIGTKTKIARLCGGTYDRGAEFDLVASFPSSEEQAMRISRNSPTFVLNGAPVEIMDHRGLIIGTLKKVVMALGRKFEFKERATRETVMLELRPSFLGNAVDVLANGKKVGGVNTRWTEAHADFFKAEKFAYAFWISPEVKKNSRLRQALVAFGLAQHRVAM